jgi:hypothetical protein
MPLRWLLAVALVAGLVGTGVAFSQYTSQAEDAASVKGETISKREWIRLKRQWSKEPDRFSNCHQQADDQKLSGRKSWPFIASCMAL